MLQGGETELLVEDVVDEVLLEEGLDALASDQCWGNALATAHAELGCRANGQCAAGFVKGKNHFKNKFCELCRQDGVFVHVNRVRVLTEDFDAQGKSKHGAGMWTQLPSHPGVGYRVINQTHKCRGPRLLVFDCEPPAAILASLQAPNGAYIIDGRWCHLRVGNGTLMPSLVHEVGSRVPAWPPPQGGAGESDDRGTKRARVPSPSSQSIGSASSTWASQQHPSPVHAPPLDTLLAAHADFGALLTASLGAPGLTLSDDQHTALAELLRNVRMSETLLLQGDRPSSQDSSAHAQVLEVERELLSWPPSPPATAASGRRPQTGDALSSTTAWGVDKKPPASQNVTAPQQPTTSTTSRGALLYLYFLILCSSAVIGQALIAALNFLLPDLCDQPHEATDPPMVVTYSVVVTAMLAGHFVVAELVGLVPTRCIH